MFYKLRKRVWIGVFMGLLMVFVWEVQAQTEEPEADAPQLLYRNGENLVLVNAVTGDSEALAGITAGERDLFEWSPDGQFVVMRTAVNDGLYTRCLNLYRVDERRTLYDEPLACEIEDVAVSHDSAHITFSTRTEDGLNGTLWLHTFGDAITTQVYETSEGNPVNVAGIREMVWSPSDHYVSFVSYRFIMGGSVNTLHIMNTETLLEYYVQTRTNGYYASYNPIWSPDEVWFLLGLKEQYVTSGTIAVTNHRGDLFLVRSETGEIHRLTYTPAESELSPHWTEDGEITYTVSQNVTLTVDDALGIQALPPESIAQPEPVDWDPPTPYSCFVSVESPDPRFVAEICPPHPESSAVTDVLVIQFDGEVTYGASMPEDYDRNSILIGWRPQ